jgi:hypothetical protein
VGAELCREDMWANGRTSTTKLIVAVRNFAKAPTNKTKLCRNWDQCTPHSRERVLVSAKKITSDVIHRPPGKYRADSKTKEWKKKTALERDWTLATAVCGWPNSFSNSPYATWTSEPVNTARGAKQLSERNYLSRLSEKYHEVGNGCRRRSRSKMRWTFLFFKLCQICIIAEHSNTHWRRISREKKMGRGQETEQQWLI